MAVALSLDGNTVVLLLVLAAVRGVFLVNGWQIGALT